MRTLIRPILSAAILLVAAPAFAQAPPTKQSAPAKQAPTKAAPAQKQAAPAPQPEPPPFKEAALTDKQVEGVIDSQKEMDAVAAKIPQPKGNQPPKPDPAIKTQFDDVARKHGFADYADYNSAVETISVVLGGFDPKTKAYVGSEEMIKQQIATVQADKKMPAKDRKAALDEMNAMLKSPPPPLQNKANIDLVGKYYDKLVALLQDNGQ